MHLQPMYANHDFVTRDGSTDIGADIFERGFCLPSDIKMTAEVQDKIIEIVKSCFN
jgi:dTDP-4-amino-4,6-dideoxygalactose transaminase